MAEVVFQSLERMLPELEELERQDVFNREELRTIVKRRTDFEYKLQKRVVEKKDILNYLEYEFKLDLLRKKRSKRLKLKPYTTAALSVTKRVHTLFRKALMKFGNDLKLWMQYIDFCKKTESSRAIGLAFGKLLQQHASNPDVWVIAAKYEFEEANNIENARSLLQKALRNNKESQKLWHEYFRLELLHVDKIKKRRKILGVEGIDLQESDETKPKQMDEFLANKTAQIVFQNAIKHIDRDIEFRIHFLGICQNFEDMNGLENIMYASLLVDFPSEEITYEVLSKRPIMQLKKRTDEIIKDEEWQRVESEVEEKFQEALEKINSNVMWEKYLNTFGELLKSSTSPKQAQRRMDLLLSILVSAEKSKHITESMYVFWSELLCDVDEHSQALQCLSNALKLYKESATLWQKYLVLKAEHADCWKTLKNEFAKCISLLREGNLPIWQMYIDLATSVGSDETKLVFEEAVSSQMEVKTHFLPQYLRWIHEKYGIKASRKFYTRLLKEPVELEFVQECIQLEFAQDRKSIKRLRSLHEKAINDFGRTITDVWISYIEFEKRVADRDLERIGLIYTKAKRTLVGSLYAEFVTKYTLLQDD